MPRRVFEVSSNFKALKSVFKECSEFHFSQNGIGLHICDFIYIAIYGITFSVLLFLATDGAVRFYILAFSILSQRVTFDALGKLLHKLLERIFRYINCIVVLTVSIPLFLPIRIYKRLKRYKSIKKE